MTARWPLLVCGCGEIRWGSFLYVLKIAFTASLLSQSDSHVLVFQVWQSQPAIPCLFVPVWLFQSDCFSQIVWLSDTIVTEKVSHAAGGEVTRHELIYKLYKITFFVRIDLQVEHSNHFHSSRIRETLNLSRCAKRSTNTKNNMCQVADVTSHQHIVICRESHMDSKFFNRPGVARAVL